MRIRPTRPHRVRLWHGILFGTLLGAAHALVSDASRGVQPPPGSQGPVRVAIVLMVPAR
jgi:hypothetical protein